MLSCGHSDNEFKASEIVLQNGTRVVQNMTRSSRTAWLAQTELVRCIEERATAFQGFGASTGRMEELQVVKYGPSAQYRNHYDWSEDLPRQSTFFVYLYANGTGGGTNFPLLDRPAEEEWCKFLDCATPADEGVTFKPIVGNAVYWENLQSNGSIHRKTLHAGLPVTSGEKIGLNIWTRKREE